MLDKLKDNLLCLHNYFRHVCNCCFCSGLKTNVSNFFGVGNDDTIARWQGRVQQRHGKSRLVGRGYKPTSNAGETPDITLMPSAMPATTPVVNQSAQIRDPYRR